MTTYDANDLLAGGPPSFSFDNIGDIAAGHVTNLDTAQVRDFTTREPRFYDDGKPMMQAVITLRQDDNEEKRLYVKPAMKAAIRDAMGKAGVSRIEIGGLLKVKFDATEEPKTRGMNPKKVYKAKYEPPVKTVSAEDLI